MFMNIKKFICKKVGKHYSDLRKSRNITISEIAKFAGVSRQAVRRFELGNVDSLSYFIIYNMLLNVNGNYIDSLIKSLEWEWNL